MSVQQSIDPIEFRNALGSFTTGVTIVTTNNKAFGDVGLTANSFNSVSLDPPMVLWSLAKSAGSLQAFQETDHFAVHILSADQQELSNRFAKRGVDKFAGVSVVRGPSQIPLIQDCAARFVCETAYQYDGGDHIIFVGKVENFEHYEKLPLLFHAGQYGEIKKSSHPFGGDDHVPDDSMGFLLRKTYQQLIAPLALKLEEKNLSLMQHYFMAHVARNDHRTLESLLALFKQDRESPASKEIDDLFERGYIVESDEGVKFTTEGFSLRIELAAMYKAIESNTFENFSFEKAQTLKVLLGEFLDSLELDE